MTEFTVHFQKGARVGARSLRVTSGDMAKIFGRIRRWKEGDILFAENNWVSGAYVVTTDPEKLSGFRLG
jgi:hypothetical protein